MEFFIIIWSFKSHIEKSISFTWSWTIVVWFWRIPCSWKTWWVICIRMSSPIGMILAMMVPEFMLFIIRISLSEKVSTPVWFWLGVICWICGVEISLISNRFIKIFLCSSFVSSILKNVSLLWSRSVWIKSPLSLSTTLCQMSLILMMFKIMSRSQR